MQAWTADDCARVLRAPTEASDKYSRGVVGLRTGSPAYPGAAVLSVEGAWRAGAGLVRWIGDEQVGRLVLTRRPETVVRAGRVNAWVVGSGTDAEERTAADEQAIGEMLADTIPVVLDAGALDLLARHRAPVVLTPHAGEFERLRERWRVAEADDVVALARATDAVVLRKGWSTVIADATGRTVEVVAETAWTSTAGTGDVLAGVIGAVIAQRPDVPLLEATATGAWLHARAARLAAEAGRPGDDVRIGHPIVAMDVAEAMPRAVRDVLGTHG